MKKLYPASTAVLANDDHLMTPRETAAMINVTEKTLANWRVSGVMGLPFFKLGRAVRYRRGDVISFLNRQRHTSTSSAA
ncbi:helix-turn-helix domain-containing protein [Azospirillum fermentarium]|uniref:helix-turn-helix domain-containing protein n=1 Tax=Azospirillum fermentarium TaxID=1233114 RepID=UPI0029CAB0A3|nr:helix-turn-helix domain-containing protein [Azospirillum fermentarium]